MENEVPFCPRDTQTQLNDGMIHEHYSLKIDALIDVTYWTEIHECTCVRMFVKQLFLNVGAHCSYLYKYHLQFPVFTQV